MVGRGRPASVGKAHAHQETKGTEQLGSWFCSGSCSGFALTLLQMHVSRKDWSRWASLRGKSSVHAGERWGYHGVTFPRGEGHTRLFQLVPQRTNQSCLLTLVALWLLGQVLVSEKVDKEKEEETEEERRKEGEEEKEKEKWP